MEHEISRKLLAEPQKRLSDCGDKLRIKGEGDEVVQQKLGEKEKTFLDLYDHATLAVHGPEITL